MDVGKTDSIQNDEILRTSIQQCATARATHGNELKLLTVCWTLQLLLLYCVRDLSVSADVHMNHNQ